MREAQLRDSGAPDPGRDARRRFGSATRIHEEMRDEWAVMPRLTDLLQDCRYAARALRRSGACAAEMNEKVGDALAPQRFSTQVVTVFAGGALLLVSVGLYGLFAFLVSERTQEIGVRLALGTTRWLSSLLYQTRSIDPVTFVMVPLVLTLAGVLACLVPAYRASRVDPLAALRGN